MKALGFAFRFFFPAFEPFRDDLSNHDSDGNAGLARHGLQLFPVRLNEVEVDLFHVGKASNLWHGCHYNALVFTRLPCG
jgi:hypothetical protein